MLEEIKCFFNYDGFNYRIASSETISLRIGMQKNDRKKKNLIGKFHRSKGQKAFSFSTCNIILYSHSIKNLKNGLVFQLWLGFQNFTIQPGIYAEKFTAHFFNRFPFRTVFNKDLLTLPTEV